jgi:hypothetical protein
MSENRGEPEIPRRHARIAGEVTVYQPITILDIDEKGVQIEAPFALHNDSLHDFRLALGDRSVVVKGRVARCEIGEITAGVVYRCTVEFVEPSPHVLRAIRGFILVHNSRPPIIEGETM